MSMMFCAVYLYPKSETATAGARSTGISITNLTGKYGI